MKRTYVFLNVLQNVSLLGLLVLLLHSCGETPSHQGQVLKINGSTTVNLAVAEAAEVMRQQTGKTIHVDTQGGSSGGISMLGEGLVHLGMSSKPLTQKDREAFPQCDFHQIHIGDDAVALIVSKDIWQAGVRSITKREMQAIYEGRIKNWQKLGGPDQRIAFFNKEPGRGTWEVFAKWLYGSIDAVPQVSFPEVGGNEETRNKVATTRGALSQLSSSWADSKTVFPLSIENDAGEIIHANAENIASYRYPMSRPLYLLSDGEPQGDVKEFVSFMFSDKGQNLVRKHGYLALADLSK